MWTAAEHRAYKKKEAEEAEPAHSPRKLPSKIDEHDDSEQPPLPYISSNYKKGVYRALQENVGQYQGSIADNQTLPPPSAEEASLNLNALSMGLLDAQEAIAQLKKQAVWQLEQISRAQWDEARRTVVMRGFPRMMQTAEQEWQAEAIIQRFCKRADDVRSVQRRGGSIFAELRNGVVARCALDMLRAPSRDHAELLQNGWSNQDCADMRAFGGTS